MIKILLDQGMPRSTIARLRDGGWDAVHAYDIGLGRAPGQVILDRARHEERIVVTLDADFHALLAIANARAPSVIRIRQEGLRGIELAELLLRIWPRIERQILQGAMVTVTETAIRIRQLPILAKNIEMSNGVALKKIFIARTCIGPLIAFNSIVASAKKCQNAPLS